MTYFIERINAFSPIINSEFSFEFTSWLSILIDALNSIIQQLQDLLNTFTLNSYTATEIASLSSTWMNGVLVYDSTNDVYVGMKAGSLVQFNTSPYP